MSTKNWNSCFSETPQAGGHGPSFNIPTAARRGQASESLDERNGLRGKENSNS
ncbi:MAG: hypothetical protein AAB377_03270 [Patescibacteria group bacterium]